MLKVYFKDLANIPEVVLAEAVPLFQQLREAAIAENDLHAFLCAELTLASLTSVPHMLAQPQCYREQAYYLKGEPTDSVDTLLAQCMSYVYNGAFA